MNIQEKKDLFKKLGFKNIFLGRDKYGYRINADRGHFRYFDLNIEMTTRNQPKSEVTTNYYGELGITINVVYRVRRPVIEKHNN